VSSSSFIKLLLENFMMPFRSIEDSSRRDFMVTAARTFLGVGLMPWVGNRWALASESAHKNAKYDSPALTLMNKAVYDKLPKEQQEALTRATARNPSAKLRAEVRGFENVLYGMHEKAGGQIVVATQEQRDVWRKAMEPVYPQIVKETGGDSTAFFTAMENGRKACVK
jgi:hypothetical protein